MVSSLWRRPTPLTALFLGFLASSLISAEATGSSSGYSSSSIQKAGSSSAAATTHSFSPLVDNNVVSHKSTGNFEGSAKAWENVLSMLGNKGKNPLTSPVTWWTEDLSIGMGIPARTVAVVREINIFATRIECVISPFGYAPLIVVQRKEDVYAISLDILQNSVEGNPTFLETLRSSFFVIKKAVAEKQASLVFEFLPELKGTLRLFYFNTPPLEAVGNVAYQRYDTSDSLVVVYAEDVLKKYTEGLKVGIRKVFSGIKKIKFIRMGKIWLNSNCELCNTNEALRGYMLISRVLLANQRAYSKRFVREEVVQRLYSSSKATARRDAFVRLLDTQKCILLESYYNVLSEMQSAAAFIKNVATVKDGTPCWHISFIDAQYGDTKVKCSMDAQDMSMLFNSGGRVLLDSSKQRVVIKNESEEGIEPKKRRVYIKPVSSLPVVSTSGKNVEEPKSGNPSVGNEATMAESSQLSVDQDDTKSQENEASANMAVTGRTVSGNKAKTPNVIRKKPKGPIVSKSVDVWEHYITKRRGGINSSDRLVGNKETMAESGQFSVDHDDRKSQENEASANMAVTGRTVSGNKGKTSSGGEKKRRGVMVPQFVEVFEGRKQRRQALLESIHPHVKK